MGRDDFITTASGMHFTPFSPRAEQIRIGDVAHALSNLCRANGHCRHFYSVAQHSINCAREAAARGYSRRVQLACLLHDASEAYLSDITRPVKQNMPAYLDFEKVLQDAIFAAFGLDHLTDGEQAQIISVDDALLWYEFLALMPEPISPEAPRLESSPEFGRLEFESVEQDFLNLFSELSE
ncbi:MAG: HD domain-containing protein [Ruminococcaceae bacterium]|nr:HD domain-containing protein [Oscillospiraceae bacterium]